MLLEVDARMLLVSTMERLNSVSIPCIIYVTTFVSITPCQLREQASITVQDDVDGIRHIFTAITPNTLTICIIDHSNVSQDLFSAIRDIHRPMIIFEAKSFYNHLSDIITDLMKRGIHAGSRLSFVVFCGNDTLLEVITQVPRLDVDIGQGSYLRHFSTWLILSVDPLSHLNTTLDNVAYLRFKQNAMTIESMHTLLWRKNWREWSNLSIHDPCTTIEYVDLFPNTKLGLNGRKLQMATLEWPPFTKRHIENGTLTYRGTGVDTIDLLSRKLNFSYVIVEPPDQLWGQKQENGSWTGVLGMLQRGEIATCPTPYGLNYIRNEVVDYSFPLQEADYSLVYRMRNDNTNQWLFHVASFSWHVWLCNGVVLVWSVLLLVLFQRLSPVGSMPSVFETAVTIPLRQAIVTRLTYSPAMIYIFTWSIFCLIMASIYSAKLVANTAVRKVVPPFTSLQEIIEQDEYSLGVNADTVGELILKTSDDPLLKRAYQKIVSDRKMSIGSTEYLNNQIVNEKYAFFIGNEVEDQMQAIYCDISKLKETFFRGYTGLVFPKQSPLRHLFNLQIRRMFDSGVLTKLLTDKSPEPRRCESTESHLRFQLTSLRTALTACVVGVMIAIVALIFERYRPFCS